MESVTSANKYYLLRRRMVSNLIGALSEASSGTYCTAGDDVLKYRGSLIPKSEV